MARLRAGMVRRRAARTHAGKQTTKRKAKSSQVSVHAARRKDGGETHHSLRGFPHTCAHGPHSPPWHSRSHTWNPQPNRRPHAPPQPTRSRACAHRTLSTRRFPHAHSFVVRNGHGGHPPVSSAWHACGERGCPHAGGGRAHGCGQRRRVPHGIGGSRIVRPQWQIICARARISPSSPVQSS